MPAKPSTTKTKPTPPTFIYKVMLVSAALIWGSSFVVMKDAIGVLEPSWLIGIRFLLTGAVLALVFFKRVRRALDRGTLIAGVVLGVLIFAAYWFQTVGLNYTTPGKNAFLTELYCVLVPLMFWFVAKRRPTKYNIAAAFLCIVGVGFVSLANDTFTIGFGDFMTVICGIFFAAHIVAASIFSKGRDMVVLTAYQFWVSGILGVIVGALTETPPEITAVTPDYLFNMAYLVIFCSCIAMGFQNTALKHVPPAQASILLSLESIFGVLFSVILYGETLTAQLVIGFALIFCAIILSEAFPLKKPAADIDVSISEDATVFE